MKCFIVDEKNITGGGQVVLNNIISMSVINSYEISLFTSKGSGYQINSYIKKIYYVPFTLTRKDLRIVTSTKCLINILVLCKYIYYNKTKPDIIIFNGLLSCLTFFPFYYIYKSYTIWIEHNTHFYLPMLTKYLINKNDIIVCVADSVKENIIKQTNKNMSYKLKVIYNGTHFPKNIDFKIIEDEINLGFVGRLSEEKDPFACLTIYCDLIKRYPNLKIKLNYYGDGPLKDTLSNYIADNKIENVFVHGKKPQNEIYSRINILILTSRFEAFPLVLIESLSHGIPTVSFDVGDIAILAKKLPGIIIIDRNPMVASKQISDLNFKELQRQIIDGYNLLKPFSLDKMIGNYNNIIQKQNEHTI